MAEPNILLTRIDNRLIHGQVATQWTSTIGANLILVANDNVASNQMRQKLMDMAAPQGVATRYFSVQKTIDVIHKAAARQHIFLSWRTPRMRCAWSRARAHQEAQHWQHAHVRGQAPGCNLCCRE